MKRGSSLKRTPWPRRAPAAAPSRPERLKPVAIPLARPPVYWKPANEPTMSAPKSVPQRNPALLALARGQACLLQVPGACSYDRATTVACHSNQSIHGKAGARKADDQWTVHACAGCHYWLDFGSAPAAEKSERFSAAHMRMVEVWRGIAAGGQDATPKERAAAQWALDRLI